MKLFNPFKAHIVQCGDKYLVRRWYLLAWFYKETESFRHEEPHWWNSWEYASKYCECDSLAQAIALRDKKWLNPNKKPNMKVIHG
jgi:hypothetical protein